MNDSSLEDRSGNFPSGLAYNFVEEALTDCVRTALRVEEKWQVKTGEVRWGNRKIRKPKCILH